MKTKPGGEEAVLTDEIKIGPEVAPGVRAAIRRRGDETEPVYFTEHADGAPINPGEEYVRFGKPARDGWRPVTSVYKAAGDGPAQVATPSYREGYDRIFGKKQQVGQA